MENLPYSFDLSNVSKPSRYTGLEFNAFRKRWEDADVRWLLAFPDVYEVGMSHIGLKILYHRLNREEGILADRVYAPWPDMEAKLIEKGELLKGVETCRPPLDFDFVGFSLQYELSYTNVLTILKLGGLPLWAEERKESYPFVVAGGPCVFNGEPMADFFDFMVLGEGEEVVRDVSELFREWKKNGNGSKRAFLEEVRKIAGIYVPSFFSFTFLPSGPIASCSLTFDDYAVVNKRVISNLDDISPLVEEDLVPSISIIHDRLSVEIARGCTRGCRFCQAGFIYRPVRERNPDKIIGKIINSIAKTGYEELSLLSLSAGDYCSIGSLINNLVDRLAPLKVALSLPSLRVGTLTSEMMDAIKKVRKTGFTLAAEAGTERLRRIINKDIDTQLLFETAEKAFMSGWRIIKLYFMVGLPFEEEEDVQNIVNLCETMWKIGKPYKSGLHVAVSTFVPKAHTPFQWFGQKSPEEIKRKLEFLKESLRRFKNVEFKWHNPAQSFWEAVFARGDRRLGRVIHRAWMLGARMDGWTEEFKEEHWMKAVQQEKIDPHFFAVRTIRPEELLPWDHLSCGVSKDFLLKELERASLGQYTSDCRSGKCHGCGVCNFKNIQPVLAQALPYSRGGGTNGLEDKVVQKEQCCSFWYRFSYNKLGTAKYLGQNDLQKVIARALRRSGAPLEYSKGYHPHPKISFNGALPVGIESYCESGWLALREMVDPGALKERWNRELPEGLVITGVEYVVSRRKDRKNICLVEYLVEGLGDGDLEKLRHLWISRVGKVLRKKNMSVDVSEAWRSVREYNNTVSLLVLEKDGLVVRPKDLLALAGVNTDSDRGIRIAKVDMNCIVEEEVLEA